MSLNIGNSSVEPYFKYNARSGQWTIVVDANDVRTIVEPTFLADFESIRVGWMRFREGTAPERVLDPSLQVSGPQPGEELEARIRPRRLLARGRQARVFVGQHAHVRCSP
jgi:hypothetical protein